MNNKFPIFNIDEIVAQSEAISKEPRPALCPLCHSSQVQVCIDFNNRDKDWCRCRECKCQAPAKAWNKDQGVLR